MKNKCYVFKTYTRDQLVALIHDMANALPAHLITNTGRPFILSINGTTGGGKSLFWDEIKNALLGKSAKKIQEQKGVSLNEQSNHRHYERWKGRHKDTRQALRIAFADLLSLGKHDAEINTIENYIYAPRPTSLSKLSKLACLFLLSNGDPHHRDLHINVFTDVIDIKENWERETTIIPRNPQLVNDPRFQGFLKHQSIICAELSPPSSLMLAS